MFTSFDSCSLSVEEMNGPALSEVRPAEGLFSLS
jgi:hypothetical protein